MSTNNPETNYTTDLGLEPCPMPVTVQAQHALL